MLRKIKHLPKLYQGKEVTVTFENKANFTGTAAKELGLPLGATVEDYLKVQPSNDAFRIYASGKVADQLLDLPKGAKVTAKMHALFGIEEETDWTDDGPMTIRTPRCGLLIVEIVDVQAPPEAVPAPSP
jgi:hypothetical protein